MEKLYIYYDMDNTLCRFSENKLQEKEALKKMYNEGYFRDLRPIDNCVETLDKLSRDENIELFILSTCIKSPYVKTEKTEWLKNHVPFIKNSNIIFCEEGTDKITYIKTPLEYSILVDDFKNNLIVWEKEGGIAIKKRDSDKKGYRFIVRNHLEIFDIIKQIRN